MYYWNWETIFTDIIGLYSTTVTHSASKAIEFGEKSKKRAITLSTVIQGHRGRYQSKARMRRPIMPVSHRASYGLYGQTRTVNAYGHPQIYPRYGLIRSARTVSTVSSHGLYGHARSPVRPVRMSPVRSLRSVVRSIRSVATVTQKGINRAAE